eukprot:TRINITY_DN54496_c0_g1_i1.p1 TRINITY_DN54496_c0_g1~~TRINITY_DN54496_c0_g1_i1.p1  ORF type:complete len:268 (-),score=62.85 TRINITY_DN54496_c0_g1_i1:289-1092(-)
MAAPPLPDPGTCTCDGGGDERKVTAEEMKEHCSEQSCWVILKGDVWDLTPFLADHPGGPGAILEYAGRDATALWESIHPPEVLSQLKPSLRIGIADNALAAAAVAPTTLSEQLLHACKMGGSTELDGLLAAKADPNIQGGPGREAPMHWAGRKGAKDMVERLLAVSAHIDPRDVEEQTPLHLAVRNSHQKLIPDLVAAKADINAKDKRGETPLHAAAALGSVRLIKAILAATPNASTKDSEGNTAAEVASEHGHMAAEDLITQYLEG